MTGKESPEAARTAAQDVSPARRLLPFVAVGIVGVLAVTASRPIDGRELAIAIAVGLVAIAMVVWLPWARLPSVAGAVPALLFIASVAILRDAAGGPVAGVGPLVLLPVLWLGLYGTRLQLALVVPAIGIAFFVPIVLVGAPEYPASQWAVGALYVAVALLIGPSVQRLISRIQSQAD